MKLNLVYLTMYMILHYLKYVPIFSLYISLSTLNSNSEHKIDLKLKELLSYKNSTLVSKLNKAQQGVDRTNLYLQKLYYVERYSCSIYLLMHGIPMVLPYFIFLHKWVKPTFFSQHGTRPFDMKFFPKLKCTVHVFEV